MDAAALLAMKEFAGDDGDINLDSLIFEDGADEALASMLASPSGLPLEFDFEGGDTSSTDLEDDELGSIGSSDTNTSTSSKPSSPSKAPISFATFRKDKNSFPSARLRFGGSLGRTRPEPRAVGVDWRAGIVHPDRA